MAASSGCDSNVENVNLALRVTSSMDKSKVGEAAATDPRVFLILSRFDTFSCCLKGD